MIAGLVKDESERFYGYNWHDEYAEAFRSLGDDVRLYDFKRTDWATRLEQDRPHFLLWRAWHRPDDRDDAKNKILFVEKSLGIPIFPTSDMYAPYDNKILQTFVLRHLGFDMPRTEIFRDREEALLYAQRAPLPIVSKCSEGACGENVWLITDRAELKEHIRTAFNDSGLPTSFPWVRQKGYVYLQQFIPTDRDLRIISIGDRVELAFWRENPGSWKKNISSGGRINPHDIPRAALDVALKLARTTGFHWCACDMIIVEHVPMILEYSAIFGFSRCGDYEKHFGSRNAHILRKQALYLHGLMAE